MMKMTRKLNLSPSNLSPQLRHLEICFHIRLAESDKAT